MGPMGACQGPPGGPDVNLGPLSRPYIHNDTVESCIVMQIIFADIFVPQDFTMRLLLGSVDPQTCVAHK